MGEILFVLPMPGLTEGRGRGIQGKRKLRLKIARVAVRISDRDVKWCS